MMKRLLLIVVAAWQIEMSVECATRCIVRPATVPKVQSSPSTEAPCKEGQPCPPKPQPQQRPK